MDAKEIEAYNKGVKDALMQAAKIPTTNLQNCITYWQIEILQLEDKIKVNQPHQIKIYSMTKEEILKQDLILFCKNKNKSIYDCAIEFFSTTIDNLELLKNSLEIELNHSSSVISKLQEENLMLKDIIKNQTYEN